MSLPGLIAGPSSEPEPTFTGMLKTAAFGDSSVVRMLQGTLAALWREENWQARHLRHMLPLQVGCYITLAKEPAFCQGLYSNATFRKTKKTACSDTTQPTNMTLLPPFLLIASLTASGALSRECSASALSTVTFWQAGHSAVPTVMASRSQFEWDTAF